MSGPIIVTPPTSLEPLAPNELPLGDLDRDRTTDAADAARWLRTMRIPVHTYAVIDDEHRGVGLPRRGWDYLVKTISPHCLRERYGLPVDPMPPERVPGLAALVDACLDVPTSYWRTFADAGFAFLLAENLGRLAKGWTGDVDGVPHRLVFLHRANGGYTGRLSDRLDGDGFPTATGFTVRAGRRVAIAWAWEPLTDVEFDAAGIVSFVRPATGDRWSGRVDDAHDGFSTGTSMVVTVRRRDGGTVGTTFVPRYARGGTFAAGGFGFGGTDACETDEWTVGQGPPAIIMNPAAAAEPFTIAHEMGHLVEYAVRRPLLPFIGDDLALFQRVFTGGNEDVASGDTPLPGSGYVTGYAASGSEDLAETYAYFLTGRDTLAARLREDRIKKSSRLAVKAAYVADRVHLPDPGPAVATPIGPGEPASLVFATRATVRMTRRGQVENVPLPRTRLSVAAAADSAGGVRVFAVGTDLRIRHVRWHDGSWGPVGVLSLATRLPVAASRARAGFLAVVVVDRAGFVNLVVVDERSGTQVESTLLRDLRTDDRPGLAGGRARIALAATDEQDRAHVMWLDGTLTPTRWEAAPGTAIGLRDGVTAAVVEDPDGRDHIYLAGLDDAFRLRVQRLSGPGAGDGWKRPTPDFVSGASPVLSRQGTLLATGLRSARVHRHRWGTDQEWVAIPDL